MRSKRPGFSKTEIIAKALHHVLGHVRRSGSHAVVDAVVDRLARDSVGAIVDTIVSNAVIVVVSIKHAILVTMSSCQSSTPASTVCEDRLSQFRVSKLKGRAAVKRDVVEAPVPNGGVCHAVRGEGHHGANNGAGNDVIPVVELVDGQRTADEHSAKDRSVNDNQLPHARVVVGEDLQLGVQVEVQIYESTKGSGGVARGEGLETVVNGVWVAGADVACEHDLLEASAVVLVLDEGGVWLAHGEEVRTQATDEPLEEDLEDGGGDEGVEDADDGIVGVPERADPDLHAEDHEDGN